MVFRATGANENSDYWPLGNVSDDGPFYAKANLTISFHSGFQSTRVSDTLTRVSDPLGFRSTRVLIHFGSYPLRF